MVIVHRAHGFRFVIFTNDHSPAHVHVFGHGGEARIILADPSGVTLDWVVGIGRGDTRRLLQETKKERERLLASWGRIHGR